MTQSSWRSLAGLLNDTVGDSADDLDGLINAACTCFLENLATEEHPLRPLLRGEALADWNELMEPPADSDAM